MLVGFSGKIGTGKTTLANLLVDLLQSPRFYQRISATRIAFGDKLKEEAASIYEFPIRDAYENKDKVISMPALSPIYLAPWKHEQASIREVLQYYATEICRYRDEDYWIKAIDAKIKAIPTDEARIVFIDDVRFTNELEYVKRHGVCYRLECYQGWQAGENANHISETALDNANFDKVYNPEYGQLEELAMCIRDLLVQLYSK